VGDVDSRRCMPIAAKSRESRAGSASMTIAMLMKTRCGRPRNSSIDMHATRIFLTCSAPSCARRSDAERKGLLFDRCN